MSSDDDKSIHEVEELERRGVSWNAYDNLLEPQRKEFAESAYGQMIYNQIMRFDAEAEAKEHMAKYLELEKTHAQGKRTSKGMNNGRCAGKRAFAKGVETGRKVAKVILAMPKEDQDDSKIRHRAIREAWQEFEDESHRKKAPRRKSAFEGLLTVVNAFEPEEAPLTLRDGAKLGYVPGTIKVVGKHQKKAAVEKAKEEDGVADVETDGGEDSDYSGEE